MSLEEFRKRLTGPLRWFTAPIRICVMRFGQEYVADAEFILSFICRIAERLGDDLDEVLMDYLAYVENQIEEQKAFNESGVYAHTRFAEVEELLQSEAFQRRNLYTLSLSYVLSPYRYRLLRYVRDSITRHLRPGSRCLEIATGTGLDAALAAGAGAAVYTYDLNRYSSLCLDLLQVEEDVHFKREFYSFDEEGIYDHCLMIELLEHLEEPAVYLENARRVLKPGGTATITFAMRMPQVDHLYVFRSVDEARAMVGQAKMDIVDEALFISSALDEMGGRGHLEDSPEHAAVYACTIRR